MQFGMMVRPWPGGPGDAEQGDIEQEQCSSCRRWFHHAGIEAHREACDIGENPYYRYDDERGYWTTLHCMECEQMVPWDADDRADSRWHAPTCEA